MKHQPLRYELFGGRRHERHTCTHTNSEFLSNRGLAERPFNAEGCRRHKATQCLGLMDQRPADLESCLEYKSLPNTDGKNACVRLCETQQQSEIGTDVWVYLCVCGGEEVRGSVIVYAFVYLLSRAESEPSSSAPATLLRHHQGLDQEQQKYPAAELFACSSSPMNRNVRTPRPPSLKHE